MGSSLPGFMMGANTDPGQVMGRLFADAPRTSGQLGASHRAG